MANRVTTYRTKISSMLQIVFLIGMLFGQTSIGGSLAKAQFEEDGWSQPVNLSQSGATSNPVMVMDDQGVIHVIWNDKINGTMYTKREGGNWSPPMPVKLHFRDNKPSFLADSKGTIHTFWKDVENRLLYSRVAASDFASTKWSAPLLLAYPVLDFHATVGSNDDLHIVYLQTRNIAGLPAGVYYQHSNKGGTSWDPAVLLYESLYFRALPPANAHVQIATGTGDDNSKVYVVWDNRSRGRIFLAESSDGGETWASPIEVDKPVEGEGGNPVNIHVGADGEKALLVWQSGPPGGNCELYYQWSLDESKTWQPRQQVAGRSIKCPKDFQILNGNEGPVLLLIGDQVTVLAWNGTRWSDPQLQAQMNIFVDPETELTVNFGCQQAVLVGGQELDVVGCDQNTNGDIWWMDRRIAEISNWFPQGVVWDPLATISRSDKAILSLASITDSAGRVHIFGSQTSDPDTMRPDTALSYFRQEENALWSQPVAVLNSTNEIADKPTVAMSPDGRILIAWRRGEPGQIFFSQVAANLAVVPANWSLPQQLSNSSQANNSPDLLVDRDGKIFVAYAVPTNEGRGIYLSYSVDGGQTWSAPAQIFDAAGAGWEMVDLPRLAVTPGGSLHILWNRYSFSSGSPTPVALLYARSEDGGDHWSKPEEVVNKPVQWSEIVGIGDGIVHRFWQEFENGQSVVWDEQSIDNGQKWQRNSITSVYGDIPGMISLASNSSGNFQLLQLTKSNEENYALHHVQWDSQRWRREPTLDLNISSPDTVNAMAVTLSPQGELHVVVDSRTVNTGSKSIDNLFYTKRLLELETSTPPVISETSPTSAPTEEPTLEPTTLPTPSPTIDLSSLSFNEDAGIMGNSYSGLILGGIVAVVIVTISCILGLWFTRGFRRR